MSVLVLSLALACLMILLASCQQTLANNPSADTTQPPVESTQPSETEAPALEAFPIVVSGEAKCRIIRPEIADKEDTDAAVEILNTIKTLTGLDVEISTDWVAWNAEHDPSTIEILVGKTSYPESQAVLNELAYGEYAIAFRGNKLVVTAWAEDVMNQAAAVAAEMMTAQYKDGSLVLSLEDKRGIGDKQLAVLPMLAGGNVRFIQDVGNLTSSSVARQVTIGETTFDDFNAYRRQLEGKGYTLKQENVIGDNHFATYSAGEHMVTMYHLPASECIRLIVEEDRAISPEFDKNYTTIADTTVWQMPNPNTTMNAYVVQLADGSFVLNDTGFESSADGLYNYMRARTPAGEKIRISAVFITHPHVDHRGGLSGLSKYRKDIECEAFFLNYGASSVQDTYSASTLEGRWADDVSAAKVLGAKPYVMRSGQKYEIANAVFEVLWTPEDFGNSLISDYNNACVVTRMTVGDKKMIFLGDLRDKASPILSKTYGAALDCDIITVAHHGFTGSVFSVYENASPEIVFWPANDFFMQWVDAQILAMECVKHHYLGDKDASVTLATK